VQIAGEESSGERIMMKGSARNQHNWWGWSRAEGKEDMPPKISCISIISSARDGTEVEATTKAGSAKEVTSP
jgi:hypothetical protein